MKSLPLALLIAGGLLFFGAPLAGLAGTIFSMIGAFHDLGDSGISDPRALANYIGNGLIATWAGLILAMAVGLPMVSVGVILCRRQKTPGAK